MANTFANHAHNDLLELWLEAGVPGAVVAALCAIWILRRTFHVWRAASWGTRNADLLLARAASIGIGLVVAHSLFDYPLRTGAMMSLVAFCIALLTPPAGHIHLEVKPQSWALGSTNRPCVAPRQRPSLGPGLGLSLTEPIVRWGAVGQGDRVAGRLAQTEWWSRYKSSRSRQ